MWLGNVADSTDLQLLRQGKVVVYAETVSGSKQTKGRELQGLGTHREKRYWKIWDCERESEREGASRH